ncbi:type IV toxin-antitoxin system AbiEi family antitoxin [Desulfobacterales bacterium HSG17]|nr:type IV toxin-antitoxin system AbiEi family antitoxin [Desulfobacterales bacterium HSG17]
MNSIKRTKINQLIRQWPRGTVGTASHLSSEGYSHDLLTKYKKSGWIESFGRGAYILSGDKVSWPGALYAIQTQLGLNFHAGGKTALEIKGFAHYLPTHQRRIFTYAPGRQKLPAWFKNYPWDFEMSVSYTNLFPSGLTRSFSQYEDREFSIRISGPERAAMEMIYLVPQKIGFEESSLIMENLISLRPEIVQTLLKNCNSIKVKRLFMYMAEKYDHPWINQIDLSNIDSPFA